MSSTPSFVLPSTDSPAQSTRGAGIDRRSLLAGGAGAAGLLALGATTGAETAHAALSTRRMAYNQAYTRIGAPYVWGAAGPWRFDCSGLLNWSFARLERDYGRTTRQLWSASTPIYRQQRTAGDLIFFGYGRDAYHVGLYAGNGCILDSPKPGGVVRRRPLWTSNVHYRRIW